jgi:hypothetical protein
MALEDEPCAMSWIPLYVSGQVARLATRTG